MTPPSNATAPLPEPNSPAQLALRKRVLDLYTRISDLQRQLRELKGQHLDRVEWPWWHCLRCGHDWQSDSPTLVPRACARCHTRSWNIPPGERRRPTNAWAPRNPLSPPNPNWKPLRGRRKGGPRADKRQPLKTQFDPTTGEPTLPPLPRMADVLSMKARSQGLSTMIFDRAQQREEPQPESLAGATLPPLPRPPVDAPAHEHALEIAAKLAATLADETPEAWRPHPALDEDIARYEQRESEGTDGHHTNV